MRSLKHPTPAEVVAAATEAAACASAAALAVARLMEAVQSRPSKIRRRPQTCKPPRATAPVVLRPRPPAIQRFGRLHFGCPACRRSLVLKSKLRAKLVSCPNCYSGIRVPDPRRGIAAQNLGRTLAPLLHPERFESTIDRRLLMPWLFGGMASSAQVMNIGGALLLFGVVAALTPVALAWATSVAPSKSLIARHSLAAKTGTAAPSPHAKALAAEVVRSFLAASTPEAKARWVVQPDRTSKMLTAYYSGLTPEQIRAEAAADLGDIRQGYYVRAGDNTMVSEVPVTRESGEMTTYLVEHHQDGPKIAWAESVGFSPVPWEKVLAGAPGDTPATLRVLACRDDYYNYAFRDESRFSCIRLHDPRTREILGYAYAERRIGIEQSLQIHLPPAGSGQLQPVMVSVRPVSASAGTHQVELVGPVTPGWQEARPEGEMTVARR